MNGNSENMLDEKLNQWLSWNKNAKQNEYISKIASEKKTDELEELLLKRLEFGTAGLRGRMGPGFSQMNELVVIQTAQGLCACLKQKDPELLKEKGIAIGYDGRHNSKRFAELTAATFIMQGFPVFMFRHYVPTPYIPFTISTYGCVAGVMVTASHNPKEDNGYKVYYKNGAQIVSPMDKEISSWILQSLVPDPKVWDAYDIINSNPTLFKDPVDIEALYNKVVLERTFDVKSYSNYPIKITYTAMHGVGYPFIKSAFKAANLPPVNPVVEQVEIDPEFSTVKFPNPEEGKSCLDLSFRTANETGSTIILANDPDADRLAVAEKSKQGEWKLFSGNEMGALLGWWEVFTFKNNRSKKPSSEEIADAYLISSTVSSKILKAIARSEGLQFVETLTGFKWMGNKAFDLERNGKRVLFAFEEAIGYMCGTHVLDKDGVTAAVRVAEMAHYLYTKENVSLQEKLAKVYQQYGYHLSLNSYYICHNPIVIKQIFDRLRKFNTPNRYPCDMDNGKYKVKFVRDLTSGYDNSQTDNKAILPVSSSSQMITFTFENGLVATLRTSGTEPKIKYYTEFCASPSQKDINEIHDLLTGMVKSFIQEFLCPDANNLEEKSS